MPTKYAQPVFILLGLALLVVVPPMLGHGLQNALINVLIASLFAVAYNLLSGQAGLLSFGHAAYFGVGAFATLHLMRYVEAGFAFPTVLLPLAGAAAGLVVGAFFGFFSTMRSGVYFALVTLAIAELFHALAPHWQDMFGGEAGLSSMRMPWMGIGFGSILEVYYLTLAWTAVSIWLLWAFTRTPFGRLTLALRDNERRVRFLGYDAHASKVVVFALSATFSGIAGALQAMSIETANYSLFSSQVSSEVVLYTFVGGSTLFFGPAAGAIVFTLFSYLVSDLTRSWLLYQGLIFVLVMLYAPTGIGGAFQIHTRFRHQLDWSRLTPLYAAAAAAGVLIAAAVVYVTETFSLLLSESYVMAQHSAGADYPPYQLFGLTWEPLNPITWLVPIILAASDIAMIWWIRGGIAAIWEDARRGPEPNSLVEQEPIAPIKAGSGAAG